MRSNRHIANGSVFVVNASAALMAWCILLQPVTEASDAVASPKMWLAKPDEVKNKSPQGGIDVPELSWYEVEVTKLMTAVDRLDTVSIRELSNDDAKYYAGVHYVVESGKRPFLVRGLFANYTGRHKLIVKDGVLWVMHSSLGRHSYLQFSPLVVNLSSRPRAVIVEVFVAE